MTGTPRIPTLASVEQLAEFDAIIDVRSPSEFAEDHIPGAVNYPVLDDAQRARVGTLYAQVSPFAARKLGAALVARNIAQHLEDHLQEHPKQWRPLVVCWRGGQRSGAMVTVLSQIGWPARQLEGGYRAYRRKVIADLEQLPARLRFVVLHGPTGSGKTALLQALHAAGGQVLDLEALAQHRGSVLGGEGPGEAPGAQPGQKAFETRIWDGLRALDPARPVYVESESRRIGRLGIPGALFAAMIESPCLRIAAPLDARVDHLLDRYADVYRDPQALKRRCEYFLPLHGRKTVEQWRQWIDAGRWRDLAQAMVCAHYDPAYRRGGDSLYRRAGEARVLELASLGPDAIIRAAQAILQNSGARDAE
jgi:tRNA 2-selenouridine synthase